MKHIGVKVEWKNDIERFRDNRKVGSFSKTPEGDWLISVAINSRNPNSRSFPEPGEEVLVKRGNDYYSMRVLERVFPGDEKWRVDDNVYSWWTFQDDSSNTRETKHVNSMEQYNAEDMLGKYTMLDEAPGVKVYGDVNTGDYELGEEVFFVTGRVLVLGWDGFEQGFVVAEINQETGAPYPGEIYMVPADYVVPPEIAEAEVNQLEEQYNMPPVEHPLGPHTGNANDYYTLEFNPSGSDVSGLVTFIEWAIIHGFLPDGFQLNKLSEQNGVFALRLTGEEYAQMSEVANRFTGLARDRLSVLEASLRNVPIFKKALEQMGHDPYSESEETEFITLQIISKIIVFIERLLNAQPDPSSEAGLEDAFNAPPAEHPLGPHTGNIEKPKRIISMEDQNALGQRYQNLQAAREKFYQAIKDRAAQSISSGRQEDPNSAVQSILSMPEFATLPESIEQYTKMAQPNAYVQPSQVVNQLIQEGVKVYSEVQQGGQQIVASMTEDQIDQGFRASMERIYRSLLEVGYSADEAQAQVKKLIAEIEQERQTLEQPAIEEDVSLDRQTMPIEHLGWYQSDFHEKGNEDLELPNVREEIVMPDEPTGLEKD